ncbi:hypothetical protein [Microcoleus sp. N3A4]|uniref:hypothetical protein n=1 Tax=Microcoleus sp. N3A4 TaxID=3055379 RepID=UPI002FD2347C
MQETRNQKAGFRSSSGFNAPLILQSGVAPTLCDKERFQPPSFIYGRSRFPPV